MRLSGHAAVFGEWTTIDSAREGLFLERIAPGAFAKTISENRNRIRLLFAHGQDPQVGDKPLGPLEELREDARGLYYAAPLLDGVPELVLSGLRASPSLYSASFRFSATREEFRLRPGRSAHNEDGIPERTLREVRLYELSAVTFPAYPGASAAARAVGDTVELRACHREEVLPRGLATGSAPVTIRRLRAHGNSQARELLRALERGAAVEITWGGHGQRLGRVVSRGFATSRTTTSRPSWRL
jgi:HK97 family phage prohead protease